MKAEPHVIEQYIVMEGLEPQPCQMSNPSDHTSRHPAEVVIHDGKSDRVLCKEHAAHALAHNHDLLAKAVIDLTLRAVTTD
jgi:hypothetical protein